MGVLNDLRVSRAPALAFVAMGMVWAAFAAQVPVIKAQIGAGDAAFGASFLISSLGAIAAMWLAPPLDRWLGARSVLITSAALGLCFILPGLSRELIGFTLAMLLVAAVSGVSDILMNARISEIEYTTRRPLMNLNHAIFSFAYAGTALATGLAREAGLSPAMVFALAGLFILAMCPWMLCPHRVFADSGAEPGTAATGQALVWLGGCVVLAAFFTEQAVEGWSALHLERGLGGGAAEGALGPTVLGLTMGFGRLFGQVIAARVADTVMLGVACLIAAFGTALAALAPSLLIAYLGFGLAGLGISVVVPLAMAMVGRSVPHQQRVVAIGRASVIGYGAFLIGPGVMGLVSDAFGLASAFLLVSVVLVAVAAGLIPMIARRLAMLP